MLLSCGVQLLSSAVVLKAHHHSHVLKLYRLLCSSLYFDNQLGACSVEWSTKRMTL